MNSFSEAVGLAAQHGFQRYSYAYVTKPYSEIALDPLFWEALSVALNWKPKKSYKDVMGTRKAGWIDKAHEYLDIKLSGGNEEQFFNELLKGRV